MCILFLFRFYENKFWEKWDVKSNIVKDFFEILVWVAPAFGFYKASTSHTVIDALAWVLISITVPLLTLWFIMRRVFNTKQRSD
jgi:hypothetical protein